MTAKREAELETENRMLREQVASLEKIITQMQPVVRLDPSLFVPYAAPQPTWLSPSPVWCGNGFVEGVTGTVTLDQ